MTNRNAKTRQNVPPCRGQQPHLDGGLFQPLLLWWPLIQRLQELLLHSRWSLVMSILLLLCWIRWSLCPAVLLLQHLGFRELMASRVMAHPLGLGIPMGACTPLWGQWLLGLAGVRVLPRSLADLGLVWVSPSCLRGTIQVLLC